MFKSVKDWLRTRRDIDDAPDIDAEQIDDEATSLMHRFRPIEQLGKGQGHKA